MTDATQNELSFEQKQAQFDEYFMIDQDINVNLVPLEMKILPSQETFERNIPYSFRLASEVTNLEASAIRPLRNMGNLGDELMTFLKAQSRKIDLIMSYILTMEDEDHHRLVTRSFGGGGVIVKTPEPMQPGEIAEMKLFLSDEASAIYCYGEVLQSDPCEDHYLTRLYYARIREDDREIIVRASLHQQSKQLKRKAELKLRGK